MNSRFSIFRQFLQGAKLGIKRFLKPLLPLYRRLRRAVYFLSWMIPPLMQLIRRTSGVKRRILIVYDTSSQPFSLGDILIAQEASLILCQRHGIQKVDFVVLFDPHSPASSDPVFKAINQENAFYHLASILPIAQVNPNLGSLMVLNSAEQLSRLITDNRDVYEVWPSAWTQGTRQYLSPQIFNTLLHEHYQQHGSIPQLTCRPFLRKWATVFFETHAAKRVPITVNIRNNKSFHQHRNSHLAAWTAFFADCEQRYPATFIVICALSEVEEQLRHLPNVVIAKEQGTSIEQDMALIQGAAIHMGVGSGPATMAWFNDKPYLMVNTDYRQDPFFQHDGMVEIMDDGLQRFWFSQPAQSVAAGRESLELLAAQFAKMWLCVNPQDWTSADHRSEHDGVSSWLR